MSWMIIELVLRCNSAGAISVFLGTTRDVFEGRRVAQLSYEAYEDMALDSMKDIATKARRVTSLAPSIPLTLSTLHLSHINQVSTKQS